MVFGLGWCGMPTGSRYAHTEHWAEIRQRCWWPEQRLYELVRPIVLFGDLPAERAHHCGDTPANFSPM
jgi:hypothetical protein